MARGTALLVAALALGLAGAAHAQSAANTQTLDKAKAARLAGNLDQADLLVRDVLARSPTDFRGLYTKALIELDRGQAPTAVSTLTTAIGALNGQPAPDASIYNTLGYALLKEGRVDEAANAFQKGYVQRGSLPPASQQKLLNNMSLTYRLKGDKASADSFQAQAAQAGSPVARSNIARAAAATR